MRRLIREEQRRRQEAESQREAEKRRREEAENQREEAENQREAERRRREEAEQLAAASQPRTLQQYLQDCHSLNLAIRVITDPSLTTQGDPTNPTGRIFPRRIIPWSDFPTKQEEVWDTLSVGTVFSSVPAFPSQHQLEYVRSVLRPISGEIGLRNFERDVVENAVQKVIESISLDPLLQRTLGLRGTVTFESHTNLGDTDDNTSPSLSNPCRLVGPAPVPPMPQRRYPRLPCCP